MSIMIWGHRGHRQHRLAEETGAKAYENSLKAYRDTLNHCMGVEADVIQSKDATVYLVHDTLYDGIVQYGLKGHLKQDARDLIGNRYIYQIPDADIKQLRLKDGQEIPKLRGLLELAKHYKGRTLNLELKGPNVADVAVRTVERAIQGGLVTPDQIVFSSFNFPALRELRIQTGYRFGIGVMFALHDFTMTPMFPNWPNAPQDPSYIPFRLEDGVLDRGDLRDIDPDFVHIETRCLTAEAVRAVSERSKRAKIVLWTAGEPHPDQNDWVVQAIRKFAPSGMIHAVTSDFPQDLQKHLLKAGVAVKKPQNLI